jgi:diguanylate cyclase (GGDEF)-like protein
MTEVAAPPSARKPLNLRARPANPPPAPSRGRQLPPWQVLVVDDEPAVHDLTRLILGKVEFMQRPLTVLSAMSAREAEVILRQRQDIAVVLLDVVMETDDAGLKLVHVIREDIGNTAIRIILRTGQPGQAPEEKVIVDYDINDYKEKSELTSRKLFSSLITALRSYQDITALEANRRGLSKILESAEALFRQTSMRQFATSVLDQLSLFIGIRADGILCAELAGEVACSNANVNVLASVGTFHNCGNCRAGADCRHNDVLPYIAQAMAEERHMFCDDFAILFIDGGTTRACVALMHQGNVTANMDPRLMEIFVRKISVGFQNVLLHTSLEQLVEKRTEALEAANRELERLARIDPLTAMLNRRAFMTAGTAETERSRRHTRPLSVLAADIDHFKMVNDRFGHAAGDEVLRSVAARFRDSLRASDIPARLGGEEFAALLPETSLAAAEEVAERLRHDIAATGFCFAEASHRVTISIGVAELSPADTSLDSLLSRADAALYDAKHAGRDRVACRLA